MTAPAATKMGDACVTVPTTDNGIFVSPMIIATRPTISAQYLISKIGEKARRSKRFSPLNFAIIAKIIKPPAMRKKLICAGDRKAPEILMKVSPTANDAIEMSIRIIPLEFFLVPTNISKLQKNQSIYLQQNTDKQQSIFDCTLLSGHGLKLRQELDKRK